MSTHTRLLVPYFQRETWNKAQAKQSPEPYSYRVLHRDEVWLAIPGYPYEASSFGRIRRDGQVGQGLKPHRICSLREYENSFGLFEMVQLTFSGHSTERYVDKLVCLAFHGKPSRQDMRVLHKDLDTLNNSAENLSWVDRHYLDRIIEDQEELE